MSDISTGTPRRYPALNGIKYLTGHAIWVDMS
jgi:hypothetical protein